MIRATHKILRRLKGAAIALPVALCLIAAAAPLAHATRVEVRTAVGTPAVHFAWANSAQLKAAETEKKSSDTPRLIQLVTDNWDVSSGIHAPHIDVPHVAWTMPLCAAAPVRIADLHTPVCDTGPPLRPVSRGPPIL
jgi:hypothetical protein